MKSSKINCFHSKYSHIYIEKKAVSYPVTSKILNRLTQSRVIMIDHYKDVFSRNNQSYSHQCQSQKLILAVKDEPFIYKGSPLCHSFGHEHFYYSSSILNCPYHCSYCYLKGLGSSGNLVVFVNIEDYFSAVDRLLESHSVYLSISYDSDLMALEPLVGYGKKWFAFSMERKNLLIELRTKSTQIDFLKSQPFHPRLFPGWTLSPQSVIDSFEKGTPSFSSRLKAIRKVAEIGYPVRLCFDPILYFPGWERAYKEMIDQVFHELSANDINEISIGTFRMPKDYFKRYKKKNNDLISSFPFSTRKGVARYPLEIETGLVKAIVSHIVHYVDSSKIFILNE